VSCTASRNTRLEEKLSFAKKMFAVASEHDSSY
jgi:hypothetical protein